MRYSFVGLIGVAAVMAGCATMNVSSHVDRAVDFRTYQTYDWGPADALPTGDPRLDNNPFFQDYLTGAVERHLRSRGYRRDTAGTPQLLIHYHASVTQRFEVHGVEGDSNACYPNCEPQVVEYEEGTIVIDVVDAATDKVVWRGWAQDSVRGLIDDQDRMQRQIERAVSRMFEQFPAGPLVAGMP